MIHTGTLLWFQKKKKTFIHHVVGVRVSWHAVIPAMKGQFRIPPASTVTHLGYRVASPIEPQHKTDVVFERIWLLISSYAADSRAWIPRYWSTLACIFTGMRRQHKQLDPRHGIARQFPDGHNRWRKHAAGRTKHHINKRHMPKISRVDRSIGLSASIRHVGWTRRVAEGLD
jgi:hypothetical protein